MLYHFRSRQLDDMKYRIFRYLRRRYRYYHIREQMCGVMEEYPEISRLIVKGSLKSNRVKMSAMLDDFFSTYLR